jgi:dolichyl-phosphate beta-glucosyltransferase
MTAGGLSVVIPAYNEEARLPDTLDRVLAYLRSRGQPFEVLVVDDGSTDGTAAAVERRGDPEVKLIRLGVNQGKGAAVRRGMLESRGERVLLTDADLSAPLDELPRLEARLDDYPIVCGSRGLADSRIVVRQPFFRHQMGKTFNRILRLLGLTAFRDTQCGFKLFRGDVAREVCARCRVNGFAYDVELLYLAERLGHRALELPIVWAHVPESRVQPIVDSARMLSDVVRLRLRAGRRPPPDGPRIHAPGS